MAASALPAAFAQAPGGDGSWRDVSVADYRAHLEGLDRLVAACQKQRSAEACDPAQVGPDDRVHWASGGATFEREVRYGWLRDLLRRAEKKDAAAAANRGSIQGTSQATKNRPASMDELLKQARQRLSEDWKQASDAPGSAQGHDSERKSLAAILARREYQRVSESSPRERFIEWLENWLDNLFSKLAEFGSRSPWIAFALRGLLLAVICLGLVWALVRIERRSRIRLVPETPAISGAPSAREWQLWLQDAQSMAAQGLWREAIHYLYWAAIARLESRRLWPADRARTPREYLRLLPAADPRRANLTTLTRSFERTWYGGREAGASDFKAALKQAAELGVE